MVNLFRLSGLPDDKALIVIPCQITDPALHYGEQRIALDAPLEPGIYRSVWDGPRLVSLERVADLPTPQTPGSPAPAAPGPCLPSRRTGP
jgi:hypothetical protein